MCGQPRCGGGLIAALCKAAGKLLPRSVTSSAKVTPAARESCADAPVEGGVSWRSCSRISSLGPPCAPCCSRSGMEAPVQCLRRDVCAAQVVRLAAAVPP
jgi:hypothetical protein